MYSQVNIFLIWVCFGKFIDFLSISYFNLYQTIYFVNFSPHSNLQYIDEEGKEHYHTLKGYPKYLEKKVTLLKHFLTYMNDHLLKVFTK